MTHNMGFEEVVYIVFGDYGYSSTLYGVYRDKKEAEQRRLEITLALVENSKQQLGRIIEDMGFDAFMKAVFQIACVRLDAPTDVVLYVE